jgi:hypothetical protein
LFKNGGIWAFSPEHIKHLAESKMGARNPQFGRVRSQEEKDLRSRSLSGRTLSAEHRKNIGESRRAAWAKARVQIHDTTFHERSEINQAPGVHENIA